MRHNCWSQHGNIIIAIATTIAIVVDNLVVAAAVDIIAQQQGVWLANAIHFNNVVVVVNVAAADTTANVVVAAAVDVVVVNNAAIVAQLEKCFAYIAAGAIPAATWPAVRLLVGNVDANAAAYILRVGNCSIQITTTTCKNSE